MYSGHTPTNMEGGSGGLYYISMYSYPWVGKIPYSSILAWRIPMDRGAWRATVHGVAKSQT